MLIALAGNPNCGKSTLFNILTGLNQKIGNYPGVTVDKKTGIISGITTHNNRTIELIDLPGSYSITPTSEDEKITTSILSDNDAENKIEAIIYIADASNLKRSLFFFSQIAALGKPVIFVLNMLDIATEKGKEIDAETLSLLINTRVICINARKKQGIDGLKSNLAETILPSGFNLSGTGETNKDRILSRYKQIDAILDKCVSTSVSTKKMFTEKADTILTHPVWGLIIFLALLFLIFQSIFSLAEYPMNWIESAFLIVDGVIKHSMPSGILTNLITDGIVAGLSGVLVFIPQIALLFFFIALLEDTGYMARVSFILDSMLKKVGLNGRSVIPLISGVACAVPAIMSARTIGNWKERLITIMVTPLMTCSARIPVYVLIISLVIPNTKLMGVLNLQGVVLMGMYAIGFFATIGSALLLKFSVKSKEKSYFLLEMPDYKSPRWDTIFLLILEKVRIFVFDAGKIIIAVSILLWGLSSFGPSGKMEEIDRRYADEEFAYQHSPDILNAKESSEKLEASYAGIFGKAIEPIIKPLGFDWKIGIALITSFAAREIFVGTMATIFSVSDSENPQSIREKMQSARDSTTGEKIYTTATGISLMIFYAFAMQCISTVAIVYRETKHWKWPFIQFIYMTGLAYFSSFLVYTLLK